MKSNHGRDILLGAVSNCISAMAKHTSEGNCPKVPPQCLIASSRSPLPCPDAREADLNTIWNALNNPLLMDMLWEVARMAPYVESDESYANVAGGRAQSLVLRAICVCIIHIESGRSKKTIWRLFRRVLTRVLVAGRYRGGNAFTEAFQACLLHIGRQLEGLAVKYGVASLEARLYYLFDDIRRDAKIIAERITKMAEGPNKTACDAGHIFKDPALLRYVDEQRAALEVRVTAMVHAYRTGDMSDEESRKMADSLIKYLPYVFTALYYLETPNNTNDVERIIRNGHVIPRNTQRILPDWTAARNATIIRSIYAMCRINVWIPGDIMTAKCNENPFPSGIPPPLFCTEESAGKPHPEASDGHPFAQMEKAGWHAEDSAQGMSDA